MIPARRGSHRGRQGLRTAQMREVARTRIILLFTHAQEAAEGGDLMRAGRYVRLARRIGTRYNVRIPSPFRDRFCRHCLAYLHEGRTVRTRLHPGRKVRTCLACGTITRTLHPKGRAPEVEVNSAGLEESPEELAVEEDELPEEESEDEV